MAEFHEQFGLYCQSTHVVAELTRVNPALQGAEDLLGAMTLRTLNRNVIVDLRVGEEERWHHHYSHAARKQISKARGYGLVTRLAETEADIAAFHNVFYHTMVRNNAAPEAFHPLSYFLKLWAAGDGLCLFYLTEHEGNLVAVELVTHGVEIGYSFLGGTLEEAFPLAANDFLKHSIIIDLQRRGLVKFCLGGGLVPGDGIHRYKQKFSVNGDVDFRLASRIHNQDRFLRLVTSWAAAYPDRVQRGSRMVLPYRF